MGKYGGLTEKEAKRLLHDNGLNEIKDVSKTSPLTILIRQVKKSFIFYFLVAAAIISFFVHKEVTGYAIIMVILLVVVTGFIQEYKAEKAISALKKLILAVSTVFRDGKEKEIPSTHIVVGDLLVLRSGERVPADCILLEGDEVKANEAVLTGESVDVTKLPQGTEGAQKEQSLLYMGSYITNGKCYAKVTHVGMSTKFGTIADLISTTEKKLPLQDKVNAISKIMVSVAIVVAIATGIVMLLESSVISPMVITNVLILIIAVCVSAFPEGFPVVLITTLALGASKMAKQNAIVNRMSIIETLGETTVICTDKTGTITVGEMTIKKIFANGHHYNVSGVGYSSEGEITYDNKPLNLKNHKELFLLMKTGVLCNDAKLEYEEDEKKFSILGNQTEGALLALGAKGHVLPEDFRAERRKEIPFSSEEKMMSVLCNEKSGNFVYAKGAPEILIDHCTHIYKEGKPHALNAVMKKDIVTQSEEYASEAFRTLALAYKPNKEEAHYSENDLVFLGVVALEDPPRENVKEAIALCEKAKIKVKMITGDNRQTAEAIGKQVGITGAMLLGKDIEAMSDQELKQAVQDTAIFARVKPEHKLRIVHALKAFDEIVTMTGDGVNDAPALKEAHIGVAMGKNGTDVSRSVADLTLKDDNFVTIVSAIREGRTIFDNIRKFVSYQLCANYAELEIIFFGALLAPIFGWQTPILLALQILFMNLVTDNMPAVTLGLNPSSDTIMSIPPRRKTHILNNHLFIVIGLMGALMAVLTLGVYYFVFNILGETNDVARTSALVTLILLEVFNAFSFRSFRKPALMRSPLVNKYLFVASVISVLATVAILYVPFANKVFETVPLSWELWIFTLVPSLYLLIIQDTIKSLTSEKVKAFIHSLSQ